jgi:hypothetical protein
VPHELSALAGTLRTLFAHQGTVRYVLWMNLLPAVVLTYYLLDRRAGRAPVGVEADGAASIGSSAGAELPR